MRFTNQPYISNNQGIAVFKETLRFNLLLFKSWLLSGVDLQQVFNVGLAYFTCLLFYSRRELQRILAAASFKQMASYPLSFLVFACIEPYMEHRYSRRLGWASGANFPCLLTHTIYWYAVIQATTSYYIHEGPYACNRCCYRFKCGALWRLDSE
jgi:hypothetical protein